MASLKKLPGFSDNDAMMLGLPKILAHRGCLNGPDEANENHLAALAQAMKHGFDVEFDVRGDVAQKRLVLSHDPAPWSADRDALAFLTHPGADTFHALNVKDWDSVSNICQVIHDAGTHQNFFLFDFELIAQDLEECRRQMHSLQCDGFFIAFRISEREPYFSEYLIQPCVSRVWLDEWTKPWVQQEHIAALADVGKQTYYVSPDLHGRCNTDALKRRWEQLASWGITGICTDYPLSLAQFLGANR